MADECDNPRVYGMPDDDNRTPPPEQGLRGEQANAGDTLAAKLTHTETIDGREIEVEETSGVAFAEATHAPGTDPQAPPADEHRD